MPEVYKILFTPIESAFNELTDTEWSNPRVMGLLRSRDPSCALYRCFRYFCLLVISKLFDLVRLTMSTFAAIDEKEDNSLRFLLFFTHATLIDRPSIGN